MPHGQAGFVDTGTRKYQRIESRVMKTFEEAAGDDGCVDYSPAELAQVTRQLGGMCDTARTIISNMGMYDGEKTEVILKRAYGTSYMFPHETPVPKAPKKKLSRYALPGCHRRKGLR